MRELNINGKYFNVLAFVDYSERKFLKENHGSKEDWAKLVKFIPKKATKKK